MFKLRAVTAAVLVASMASGCSMISQVNNARSGYQAVQAYQTAKGMMGAQPAFENATSFTVTTNLMPRDEENAEAIKQTFERVVVAETEATADRLGVNLSYCNTACPSDAVRIQFNEKGRDGFVQRFAMGDVVGGDLYLTQNGEILEEYPLEMGEDYAKMAEILTSAINLRIVKTAQSQLDSAYNAGDISKTEMEQKSQDIVDQMNAPVQLDEDSLEILKGQA